MNTYIGIRNFWVQKPSIPSSDLQNNGIGNNDGNNKINYNNNSSYDGGDSRGRVPNKAMQAMDQDDDEEGIDRTSIKSIIILCLKDICFICRCK